MRCPQCKKKTLIEYECKCSEKYCLNCLPYFKHNCSFDYRGQKKDIIKDLNPKIESVKVETL